MVIWNFSAAGDIFCDPENNDMAWFRNHYRCGDCGAYWEDEWSCCCDDECPVCGSGDWSPLESDDLTFYVEEQDGAYAIYVSPITAEHRPDYALAAIALHQGAARTYVKLRLASYWDAQ